MIGTNSTFDQFVTAHRWAVLTTLRQRGMPASTLVAYARDDDTLIVSTPGHTFKRRSLERDARVTICCISDAAPFNFVTIEGSATVEKDNLVAMTKRVFANIQGSGYAEPANLQAWLDTQDRVILRVHPQRVYGVIR
jgi:PPOX class probable F420-dependent enzyme